MSSCDWPSNNSASDLVPSAVSKRYSFSACTQGSSRRLRASSSLRRVSSFSSRGNARRVPLLLGPDLVLRHCLASYLSAGALVVSVLRSNWILSVRVCLLRHHRGDGTTAMQDAVVAERTLSRARAGDKAAPVPSGAQGHSVPRGFESTPSVVDPLAPASASVLCSSAQSSPRWRAPTRELPT